MKDQVFRATVVLCFILLFAGIAPVFAVDTIERTFDVTPGGFLLIDTDTGSIAVETSADNRMQVAVERSGSRAEELEVEFSQSGNTVEVHADFPGKWNWGRGPKVRFVVTVPKQFNVDLNTAGGSIRVADIEGDVRIKTSGGSLNMGEIDGTVWGRTSGGSISLDGCSRAVDVNTSGGSINIGDVGADLKAHTSGGSVTIGEVAGAADVNTSGGSISVAEVMGTINATSSGGSITATITGQPAADCKLKTSGGTVTATIASHLNLDISASCSGGKVSSDLQLGDEQKSKRSLTGTLNGGGPKLVLHTSGGSVRIEAD